MQQIVVALVIIYHGTCLRLDSNPSFPFHVQLVQELLLSTRFDSPRELQESVAQRALTMVHMRHNTEVPVILDWNLLDPSLELSLELELLLGLEGDALVKASQANGG